MRTSPGSRCFLSASTTPESGRIPSMGFEAVLISCPSDRSLVYRPRSSERRSSNTFAVADRFMFNLLKILDSVVKIGGEEFVNLDCNVRKASMFLETVILLHRDWNRDLLSGKNKHRYQDRKPVFREIVGERCRSRSMVQSRGFTCQHSDHRGCSLDHLHSHEEVPHVLLEGSRRRHVPRCGRSIHVDLHDRRRSRLRPVCSRNDRCRDRPATIAVVISTRCATVVVIVARATTVIVTSSSVASSTVIVAVTVATTWWATEIACEMLTDTAPWIRRLELTPLGRSETFSGGLGLFRGDHLHESESTGLLGMRIKHDRAALNFTVLLEETSNIGFSEARMDSGDEKIGASIDCAFIFGIFHACIRRGWGAMMLLVMRPKQKKDSLLRSVAASGRGATAIAVIAVTTRRG
ncbi:hypothetical protein KCU88_g431, partial [Aureobasidium melanogenum]